MLQASLEAFTAHLDEIDEEVAAAPTLADDLLAAQANANSWSLTFDDGGSSALAVGEELARRGWRAHFFIVTSLIGQRGFVDGSAIRKLRSMGHLIGSHSATHPKRMSSLSTAGLREEWRTSVETLSDLLGEQVRIASVPGGFSRVRWQMRGGRRGHGFRPRGPERTVHTWQRRVESCAFGPCVRA